MKFRTGYNEGASDVVDVGEDAVLECRDESLTNQADATDADINLIVKRFKKSGVLPVIERPPLEGDFTHISSYEDALELIGKAEQSFMGMSAEVRAKFDNDPERFVAFCSDERNLDKMREWGLAVKKEPEATAAVSEPKANA